jgi:LEA14-like dessication related protein
MKKLVLYSLVALLFSSCGINKQAQQIKALENCEYKFISASNITVAGTDIKRIIDQQNINLANIPALALGFLRKDIPLKAVLNVEITNPSTKDAAINNFDYIISINKQEIANGVVDQVVAIAAGQKIQVPVQLNANIYQFLSNGQTINDISKFLSGASNGVTEVGLVTIKIKPSIRVGNELVKYPGYITIDKEISNKILL